MSTPAGTPNAKGSTTLSAREVELLGFAMQSMKDLNVQLDYDKFAKLAGMTDGSARVTWGRIRRKLTAVSSGEETPGSAKAATGTPKPKGRKGGRKRKVEYVGNGEGESVAELRAPESPTDMLLELRKKAKKKCQGGASAVGNGSNGGQVLAEDGVPIKGEDGVTIKSENRFE